MQNLQGFGMNCEQHSPAATMQSLAPKPAEDVEGVSGRSWLHQMLPTVLVLAVLGGMAYCGHQSGWSMPRFLARLGREAKQPDDWCATHAVPESQCVECNPELLPRQKEYGWCKIHGVHECPLEHPDVAQLSPPAPIFPEDLARAQRALDLIQRSENNNKCKLHLRRIQFASDEAFHRAGIDVVPVWRGPIEEFISANGEITYDQTRVARLSSRLPGAVWRVDKNVGDSVQASELVAVIESAEVGRAKAEFLQAQTQLRFKAQTQQNLLKASASLSEQRIREAAMAVSEAQIRLLSARQALVNLGLPVDSERLAELPDSELAEHLQFLGLPDAVRRTLDPKTTSANLLPLKSPLAGLVVARDVVAGEVVDTAKALFVVADVRRMWLTLNVRQEDARMLSLGQEVRFRPHGDPDDVSAQIAWISTAVDEKTRTVIVRADVANPNGRLRANSFGKGRIVLRREKDAVVVPHEAVHWDGDCHVVFVRDKNFLVEGSPKVFHTRSVRLGAKDERVTEIIAGVLPGEIVASKGSGTLRAELLKGGLGEG